MLNTMIASGVASITWMMVDLLFTGRPSIIGIMNGIFHFYFFNFNFNK